MKKNPINLEDNIIISVIIVIQNNISSVKTCLESVFKERKPAYEVIVVDRGSVDHGSEWIYRNYPTVRLIGFPMDPGFIEGCNTGIKAARGKYIFILDPGTRLRRGTLWKLYKKLESEPSIGILAPKLAAIDEPSIITSAGIFLDSSYEIHNRGYLEYDKGQYNKESPVVAGSQTALFIRKKVFDTIGLLDHMYYLYYANIDICLRSWIAGYKTIYYPKVTIPADIKVIQSDPFNELILRRYRLYLLLKNLPLNVTIFRLCKDFINDLKWLLKPKFQGKITGTQMNLKVYLWNLVYLPVILYLRGGLKLFDLEKIPGITVKIPPGVGRKIIYAHPLDYQPITINDLNKRKLSSTVIMGKNDSGQLGYGWYELENLNGKPIRWCSDHGFIFLKNKARKQKQVRIQLTSFLPITGTLLCNRKFLGQFHGNANTWSTIKFDLQVTTPIINLVILPHHPFIPAEFTGSEDYRFLGIAIHRVEID